MSVVVRMDFRCTVTVCARLLDSRREVISHLKSHIASGLFVKVVYVDV